MKKCLFDSCDNPVHSHLFCKYHQYMRTDSKAIEARNKAVEPRSPIRRYKLPTSNEQGLKTTKSTLMTMWGFSNQKEMFDFVWKTREHKCCLTGNSLDNVPESKRHWCHAHIISKGLYPMFKLNPSNIMLLDPDVHGLVDNFTEDMKTKHKNINFVYWFEQVEKMKQQYKQFLLDNLL